MHVSLLLPSIGHLSDANNLLSFGATVMNTHNIATHDSIATNIVCTTFRVAFCLTDGFVGDCVGDLVGDADIDDEEDDGASNGCIELDCFIVFLYY